jgi:hypothetical protein
MDICECKMDVKSLHVIEWIMVHGHLDHFQKPLLGDRPNTKLGDQGILTLTTVDMFLFYHV